MSEQITPNPSVPTQIVQELKFPKYINNLGIIPTSYKDSMSYYECLAWLCKYLEETVIPTLNQNGEAVEELQNLYVELNSYVTHYFENLDVQEEINNKLDNLVSTGELQVLLGQQFDIVRTETQSSIANLRNETQELIDNESSTRIQQIGTLQNEINSITSGSPAGVYATVSELQTADPNHSKIYVVSADGKWYYYNTSNSSWTAGGTYQATSITRDTTGIDEIYSYFTNPLISNSETMTTELDNTTAKYSRIYMPLKKGEYVEIEITDTDSILSPSGQLVVTEENYATATYFTISSTRKLYQIHENGSFLRLHIGTSSITSMGDVTYTVKRLFFGDGIIDSLKKFNNLIDPEFEYITLEQTTSKTGNLYNDLEFEQGSINTGTTNLLNIIYTTSNVAYRSQILKVRKDSGEIYQNITFKKDSGLVSPTVLFTFNSNYETEHIYTNSDLPLSLNSEAMNNVYYVILIKYPNVSSTQEASYSTELNNIYHVGQNEVYNNFTELLDTLKNDYREKTIYLHEGTYDLYEEYGGDEFFENLPTLQPTDWRTYCKIVPKNTHIIGLGNVVLNFSLPVDSNINEVFSALNITHSCSIENIKINQTNGRYMIHVEEGIDNSTKFNTVSLNNIELSGSTYTSITIGCGINEGSTYNLNNIIDNSTNPTGFYLHTNTLKGTFLNINNSIFDNRIILQNWAGSTGNTKNSKVNINNTHLNILKFAGVNSADTVSAYSVKTLGTNDYTIETSTTTDYNLSKELVIS